ncbi:hypothetical protein JOQ06_026033 [Pogonophryne albipinna]|uniref:Uncharacterized protein n=1 Tax=Pogonophryne albipinna TaxID=1090488 RepID=A0AAD6AA70_9TELE|nr:hypothetical protein JOQ06_026033 [Pogonophryne albipinna]
MQTAIQQAVEKEERPMPDERRAFVNALVDQMMQHERNPTRAMCHSIVRLIVRSHPKSFADISRRGEVVGDGCPSLLQQVKTRVEYKTRNNTLARRRRSREGRRNTGVAGESRLTRGPVDQYGCVRWCPAELPEGETEATLEDSKRDLRNIYSEEGMGGAERAEPLMVRTYIILRRYLNRMPAPAMLEKLDNLKIREVLASYDPEGSEKAACILQLLMVYFKELTEKLMLEVDTCATAADVVNTAALPSTPCLIIQGDTMKPSGWMLSIEGQVVMGPHPFFLHGVAALFSSYYVFNLEYPVGSCTLEFIQRCLEKGSKAKKRSSINPHVSTLHRKLIDLEWSA